MTIAAISLVAYVSADVAHHVLGHGGACLAFSGQVESLSSVHVECSVVGSAIDLAGPIANLIVGIGALLGAQCARRRFAAAALFFTLAAAFNLLWFGMQLVFSAATKTDDWAWAMYEYHIVEPVRYGVIVLGGAAYALTVRVVGHQLAPLAQPIGRARIIVVTAWVTAGAIAMATAALDHNASGVMLRHAAPQSLLLPIGLLFAPARAARASLSDGIADRLEVSIPWIIAAVIVGVPSVAPGTRFCHRELTDTPNVRHVERPGRRGSTSHAPASGEVRMIAKDTLSFTISWRRQCRNA